MFDPLNIMKTLKPKLKVCLCDNRYGCCLDGVTAALSFGRAGCPNRV